MRHHEKAETEKTNDFVVLWVGVNLNWNELNTNPHPRGLKNSAIPS